MRSDIAVESVSLNFMGGSFSISYDTETKVYKLFQDSFERVIKITSYYTGNSDSSRFRIGFDI